MNWNPINNKSDLPTENGSYLVTYLDDSRRKVAIAYFDDGIWFTGQGGWVIRERMIAWLLPSAYSGDWEQMSEIQWKCYECGLTSVIETSEFSDIWYCQNTVNIEHDKQATDCKKGFDALIFPIEGEQMESLNLEELKNVGDVKPNSLIKGDCLEAMKFLADQSVDAVIADIPYG